jgi:dihydroorotate dehydrogenase
MYKYIIRPILFLFDPEFIHHFTFKFIKFASYIPFKMKAWTHIFNVNNEKLRREVLGLKFNNPVGLAAGFDKDAMLYDELASFGFGFVEIGTVTPLPQNGNPKPRLFRLPDDESLINRMGFNNSGVDAVVERLKNRKSSVIIGGNIGKNKVTPNELAYKDYEICFTKLFDYVDYFVVNVSSPNTPGLRELQDKEPLTKILNGLQNLNNQKSKRKPILLKIAPDLTTNQLDEIVEIIEETKLDGLIASNTTIDRSNLKSQKSYVENIGNGGLSGKAITSKSTEIIKYLFKKSNASFVIIGVGGIHNEQDAIEKLDAGASLIQLYTGFVYQGPSIVKNINQAILKR